MSAVGPAFFFGGHLFYVFMLLVFSAAVIAVIVLAVRAATQSAYSPGTPPMQMGAAPPARETPMEILARRFASGEITAEDYQKARDLLEGGGKT